MLPPGPKLIFTVTQRRQILCLGPGAGNNDRIRRYNENSHKRELLKDLTLRLGDLGKFLKQINDFMRVIMHRLITVTASRCTIP